MLEVAGLSAAGKMRETVHAEFQRAGFFLTHVLECPFESESLGSANRLSLLAQRLSAVATRIRRSLKPKRIVLISEALEPLVGKIGAMPFECPLMLDRGKLFALDGSKAGEVVARLRDALAIRTE